MSDFRSDRNESCSVQPHCNEIDKSDPSVTNDRAPDARSGVAEVIDQLAEVIDQLAELIDSDGA
jgi:hypothetical protein